MAAKLGAIDKVATPWVIVTVVFPAVLANVTVPDRDAEELLFADRVSVTVPVVVLQEVQEVVIQLALEVAVHGEPRVPPATVTVTI